MVKPVAGIVLAGGKGSRIGGGKPLLQFGSATLIEAVIALAAPQVSRLALNVPSTDELEYRRRFGARFDVLADPLAPGTGPLAGVVEGLRWARTLDGIAWLATFPCDAPLLPHDLVARLFAARVEGRPVAAGDGTRLQGLCALWPVGCLERLLNGDGLSHSITSVLEELGSVRCRFEDADAFFNVNTREDLAKAEALARDTRQNEV